MFDFINLAMLHLLNMLQSVTGSYGLAIIAVTALIRILLWPMNSAQTRSMKKMQELQPKLKALQERYKDQPQKMQEAMMKFYTENKFNPFAGCLPMLIQLPIFFALYGVLNSPEFLAHAGSERFLFIDKLHNTLWTHAGETGDNRFIVKEGDKFQTGKVATVHFKDGKKMERNIEDPANALVVKPQPIFPGEPITITLPLSRIGLSNDYIERIDRVETDVFDQNSKELENLTFQLNNGRLTQKIDTVPAPNQSFPNVDVLILIVLYGVLTVLYQQVMTKNSAAPQGDPGQAQMMKLMPIMFVGMLFFIPIPAGVMLYLVVTTAFMFFQTWWVGREGTTTSGDGTGLKKPGGIIDIKPDQA